MRYHSIPPRELQTRKHGLRTVDGHEVAPVTFSPRATRKEKQAKIRLQAAEANESFLPRKQKKNIIKSNLARAKQAVRPNDEAGSSKHSMNTIQEPNIIFGTGDLLHFPGPISHCVLNEFQMSAGIAQQIREVHPTLQPTLKSIETPQVGASVSMSIPSQNKSIFNLVTKSQYFKKPSYYDFTRSLHCMKKQLIAQGIWQIALPKIGCGLDKLRENSVYNIIFEIFRETDITVFIYV